ALLNKSEIVDEIVQTHSHTDGFIADYCDGDLFRSHNLFCEKPNSLQIILYFDEIEVCNPLGAHSCLQKLGKTFDIIIIMVYYVCRDVLLYNW
uniref:Uncharacterized protein n=1 Tax=Amphimedon queenslandica TaxID=400682 RepID=A0A1X7STL8_AMPQE